MAASFKIPTGIRTDVANKINDDVDGGTLKLYTGSSPGPNEAPIGTLLVTFDLPAKASNTVLDGVLTFGAIASAYAVADGTPGYFRLFKSGGAYGGDGNVGTSGASLNLTSLTIVTGRQITITSLTITSPEGT